MSHGEEEVLSEISENEAEQQISSILQGEMINEEKTFKLINHMIYKGSPLEKIEDMLWQLKKYYDDRSRYYKNMHQEIMYLFDRIDNQEIE
jgi:hypothetical protein